MPYCVSVELLSLSVYHSIYLSLSLHVSVFLSVSKCGVGLADKVHELDTGNFKAFYWDSKSVPFQMNLRLS